MLTTKEQFQQAKELRGKMATIVNDPDFAQYLIYVRAALMENGSATQEQMKGASLYQSILIDLPIPPDDDLANISSGIVHDLAPKDRTPKKD